MNVGVEIVRDEKRCCLSGVVDNEKKSCELTGEVMSDETESYDGEFNEVIDKEKKSYESLNVEIRVEDDKGKTRIVEEKSESEYGFVKCDNEKDVMKDKNEESTESNVVALEEAKKEKDVEKSKGDIDDKVSVSDKVEDIKQSDEEIYTATKLILDEMDREDQKEQVCSDLKKEKVKVGKLKRDIIWKWSDDGILRRVFRRETSCLEEEENNIDKVKAEGIQDVKEQTSDINNNNIDYKKKAIEILRSGAMPLVPPGRREWKGACTFRINLYGCDFTWPPPDWQQMTPDRKLMAWEHTAFQIEYLQNGLISPSMSRCFLLDKYNFLALPGSGKVKKEEHERGAARARFYLYQMLREVANGKYPSEAEKAQIDTLALIQNTGELQRQLASLEIPLRLAVGEEHP